jgi:hypothetical protein
MRFVFCACAISYVLKDWSGVDTAKAVCFIQSSVVCFDTLDAVFQCVTCDDHVIRDTILELPRCQN